MKGKGSARRDVSMRGYSRKVAAWLVLWVALVALHAPLLRLPYYWDEAGYYVPAALDFWRCHLLVPSSTLPTGHTPLLMVYLALAWRLFGFSALVTRAAILLVAAGTVAATYILAWSALGGRAAAREAAAWSAAILTLSPLFFAQASLVHLDLPAAFFTVLALVALLDERWTLFGVTGSLAVLSKETAIILVPVACIFAWLEARRKGRRVPGWDWVALASPSFPLAAWAIFYHHRTGYWTGNPAYLDYNLYSNLNPVRALLSLLRRLYEVFIGGFNWLIAGGAVLGVWWSRKRRPPEPGRDPGAGEGKFILLTALLAAAYVLMLSLVGGAILPRYLLPVFPALAVLGVGFIWRLPQRAARGLCLAAVAALIAAWFLNPPYPFPFEDNVAYADFIKLHQLAARYLSAHYAGGNGNPSRILTAWPASDELERPDLGYVSQPLGVVPIEDFGTPDFREVQPGSFDALYLYSRQWQPAQNWLTRFPWLERLEERYFRYAPPMGEAELEARFHLRRVARWQRRGQWVSILEAVPHN